jgi:hypothetical protein
VSEKVWVDKGGREIAGQFICRDCSNVQCYECVCRERDYLQTSLDAVDKLGTGLEALTGMSPSIGTARNIGKELKRITENHEL